MRKTTHSALWIGLSFIVGGTAQAGVLTTIDNTSATVLANALTAGGAGGITITSETLSSNTSGTAASSGLFSTAGANNFGLSGNGIVISTGDAAQDGTTGSYINGVTTAFNSNATPAQTSLLNQVASAPNGWRDVTEFSVKFNVAANTNKIFFNTVFTSAEYPQFVGQFIDGFGLFLNGTNIAFAGGHPVNVDNPLFVNTAYPSSGGNNGTQYQTTPEQGVLVQNGTAVVTYSGAVTPGSTGDTLTFIVADANDSLLDTTAFIQGLGNAPPPPPPPPPVPEPASLLLLGSGLLGFGLTRLRRQA